MSKLRVAVLGYIVRGPIGGMAWHHLHYVLGLLRLGHDVYFVEDSDDYASCYDPDTGTFTTDPTYRPHSPRRPFEPIGMGERWAYHDAHTRTWLGPCAGRILQLCAGADVVLNLA